MSRVSTELDYASARPAGTSSWLHVIAWATAIATFPLIFLGGMVTSKHAGLSVPDWPNSYGYNMFLFPPNKWVGGILYEHTHRLAATVVGMLSIALTIVAWRTTCPRWIRRLCAAVLCMVIFQGILGGLRVVLVNLDLAIVHACVAQAFFCLASFTVLATSVWWQKAEARSPASAARPLLIAGVTCVGVIYLQLMIGAVMRHFDAGLAIPDFPLAYGHLIPPTHLDTAARLDAMRSWPDPQLHLGTVSMLQIWLQFVHRLGAVAVTVAIGIFTGVIFTRFGQDRFLKRGAMILLGLLTLQITLGALTVLLRKPADVASAHVAVGALVLMCAAITTAAAMRLYFPALAAMKASAGRAKRDAATEAVAQAIAV